MAVVPDTGARWPGVHAALRAQSMAGDRAGVLRPPGAPRLVGHCEHPGRAGHPRRDQLPRVQAQQALGSDGGRAVHAVGADQEGAQQPAEAGARDGLREDRRFPAVPQPARPVSVPSRSSCRSSTSIPRSGRRSQRSSRRAGSERSCSSTKTAPSASQQTTSRT